MHDKLAEWWNRISLRTKVTGVTVLLVTLGLMVAGAGTMTVLQTYLLGEVDTKVDVVAQQLDGSIIKFEAPGEEPQCTVTTAPTEYFIAVLSFEGTMLCSNRSMQAAQPVVESLTLQQVAARQDAFTLPSTDTPGQWRVMAFPATSPVSDDYFSIVVGLDLADSNATIARLAASFLFFGLTVVILGGALTRLLVTSTFAPLREVEATAARFAGGDFSQRLGGATPNTEVGRLNRSLNSMLSRIDRAFADRARTIDQMRRFVGDASHELRTPLVSVRGYAELYRMGALATEEDVAQAMERIEKEAIRMGELVVDLLELARIDEAKPLQLSVVDLVPLAEDAALDAMASFPSRVVTVISTDEVQTDEAIEVAAPAAIPSRARATTKTREPSSAGTGPIAFAGATFARLGARRARTRAEAAANVAGMAPASLPAPAPHRAVVLAEENKIRQVVNNLVGNAIRFTSDASSIEIGVGVDTVNGLAVISVIDHGEGVPPQIREKIFQRFWRADTSRTRVTGGSGLGLAIVSAIVEAHRGSVEVVDTLGGGATFRVQLPLHTEPADAANSTTSD
ncbi:MAG: HAMP domain-containing histidine kinase [Salinibacterium sp.]|nr:HAMP domain-containing histidine kinase [Salinibacterium sp.]